MPEVIIDGAVLFSANNGVRLTEKAQYLTPQKLHEAVMLAFVHFDDEILVEACCGPGVDLLPRTGYVQFDDYLTARAKYRSRAATVAAKRKFTAVRRKEYQASRAEIILKMIEAGIPYVCNFDGCGLTEDLTVDHIHPLSRGGSDDLSNLQFLCQPHNSSKGDRLSVEVES